jgi:hypothetical protein
MQTDPWLNKTVAVASLQLDAKNPRLGRELATRAPRDIIQHLFDHDKALDVAESIAVRGYFPNEPLLAIEEDERLVVVEGNRRLAALKALREPGLLEGSVRRQVERLARRVSDVNSITRVPVTVAPNRHATDRQVAGRHVGSPVLPWQAENRASFILDKLEEGYSNDELAGELGFSLADIQRARQTRAVADMARSLDLHEDVKRKLESPRAKVFTTIQRVLDSSVGRTFLRIAPDPEHGLRGTVPAKDFVRAFTKLVTDVALGTQSSRTLNSNADIAKYFKTWAVSDRPPTRLGSFTPADVITRRPAAPNTSPTQSLTTARRPPAVSKTVLPRDFKVRFGHERLVEIRNELTKLKRDQYPNAGAVLLRVFLELSVLHFLESTGRLADITARLSRKEKLPHGIPTMRHLFPEVIQIAKNRLPAPQARMVEKALRHDPAAPFTIAELHSFVHSPELPGERDIRQFWQRTEPLFRLMLEQDRDGETK